MCQGAVRHAFKKIAINGVCSMCYGIWEGCPAGQPDCNHASSPMSNLGMFRFINAGHVVAVRFCWLADGAHSGASFFFCR